jgi:hypothetical protein
VKDLLPPKPAGINVEPWWNVEVGCVIEEDIKVYIVQCVPKVMAGFQNIMYINRNKVLTLRGKKSMI